MVRLWQLVEEALKRDIPDVRLIADKELDEYESEGPVTDRDREGESLLGSVSDEDAHTLAVLFARIEEVSPIPSANRVRILDDESVYVFDLYRRKSRAALTSVATLEGVGSFNLTKAAEVLRAVEMADLFLSLGKMAQVLIADHIASEKGESMLARCYTRLGFRRAFLGMPVKAFWIEGISQQHELMQGMSWEHFSSKEAVGEPFAMRQPLATDVWLIQAYSAIPESEGAPITAEDVVILPIQAIIVLDAEGYRLGRNCYCTLRADYDPETSFIAVDEAFVLLPSMLGWTLPVIEREAKARLF